MAGVLFPIWSPDMRYGFGHPKLQFRPPLLQYIAEIIYLICGNPFLSINLTVALFVFIAGFGMFFWCKRLMPPHFALLASCAFLSFHYFLSDIYLRGAYYEVLDIAWMPWILWAQSGIFDHTQKSIPKVFLIVCTLSFAGIWCSHPAVATFFMPLSVAYALVIQQNNKNISRLPFYTCCLVFGLLIAAPYVYVSYKEFNLVRLSLFYTEYRSFSQNFVHIVDLLTEKWPFTYVEYRDNIHPEMKGINIWAICIFLITPLSWFVSSSHSSKQASDQTQRAQFFFFCILISCVFPYHCHCGSIVRFFTLSIFPGGYCQLSDSAWRFFVELPWIGSVNFSNGRIKRFIWFCFFCSSLCYWNQRRILLDGRVYPG